MSRNGLHRHYNKLTAEERFRLDVLAMARGDLQESERLVSSCPRFSYTMTDRHFSGRWLLVMDMTLRLYVWVAEHLDRMDAMRAVRVVLPLHAGYARERMRDVFAEGHRAGARQAWGAAAARGRPQRRGRRRLREGASSPRFKGRGSGARRRVLRVPLASIWRVLRHLLR